MTRKELIREIASAHYGKHGADLSTIDTISLDEAIEWFNCRERDGLDIVGALALAFGTMNGSRRQRLGGMVEELVQQRTIDGALNLSDQLAIELRCCAMVEIRPLLRLAVADLHQAMGPNDPAPHGMREKDFDSSTLS